MSIKLSKYLNKSKSAFEMLRGRYFVGITQEDAYTKSVRPLQFIVSLRAL